jgi:hypothetical protein
MVMICKYCNKEYASYASRSNHIKRFHNINDVTDCNIAVTNSNTNVTENELKCNICNKLFNNRQTKWRHIKKCTESNETKLKEELEQLKIENNKVKKEKEEMKHDIELLKKQMLEIMNKQNKIHPKTLTKINNQLNDNKVINNINIIQLGGESIDTLFNKKQQIDVLAKRNKCLEYLVKQVHFNDNYPQFKNILITNTQNNIAYRYDKVENKFMATNKNELLDEVITERMGDIENFYDNQANYLSPKTNELINDFIAKMAEKDKKYYEDKMKDIKLVIYNNRNKVSKEITQDLEIIV